MSLTVRPLGLDKDVTRRDQRVARSIEGERHANEDSRGVKLFEIHDNDRMRFERGRVHYGPATESSNGRECHLIGASKGVWR